MTSLAIMEIVPVDYWEIDSDSHGWHGTKDKLLKVYSCLDNFHQFNGNQIQAVPDKCHL